MEYTITPSPDGRYIVIKVTGQITRTSVIECLIASNKMGQALGIDKYLMDVTESRNVASAFENYQLAYQDIPNIPNIERSACMAILVSPHDSSHGFLEVASRNSGLNMNLFRDRAEAVNYLCMKLAGKI